CGRRGAHVDVGACRILGPHGDGGRGPRDAGVVDVGEVERGWAHAGRCPRAHDGHHARRRGRRHRDGAVAAGEGRGHWPADGEAVTSPTPRAPGVMATETVPESMATGGVRASCVMTLTSPVPATGGLTMPDKETVVGLELVHEPVPVRVTTTVWPLAAAAYV